MVVKKKFLGGLKALLLVLFIFSCVTCFNNSKVYAVKENIPNTGLDNTWLSTESMLKIMTGLKFETYMSGEINFLENYCNRKNLDIETQSGEIASRFASTFNAWFNTISYNYDVNLNNLLFVWGVTNFSQTSFTGSLTLTIDIKSGGSIYVKDSIPVYKHMKEVPSWIYYGMDIFNGFNYTNSVISGIQSSTNTNTNTNLWKFSETSVTQQSSTGSVEWAQPQTAFGYRENLSEKIYITSMAPLKFNGNKKYYYDIAYSYTRKDNTILYGADSLYYYIDIGSNPSSGDTPVPEPTPIPTGSGGSSVDLSNIENSLNNIEDTITSTPSGDDFNFFNSGDLIGSLGVDINSDEGVTRMNNFWLAITNGLSSALTDDVRYISFDFKGKTVTFDNQAYNINIQDLNSLIRIACIVGFILAEYKALRKLVNMFSSGIFSQIFRIYSKIDISDLF